VCVCNDDEDDATWDGNCNSAAPFPPPACCMLLAACWIWHRLCNTKLTF